MIHISYIHLYNINTTVILVLILCKAYYTIIYIIHIPVILAALNLDLCPHISGTPPTLVCLNSNSLSWETGTFFQRPCSYAAYCSMLNPPAVTDVCVDLNEYFHLLTLAFKFIP